MGRTSGKRLFIAITAVLLAALLCGCINIAGTQGSGDAMTKQQAGSFLLQSKANIETINKVMEETGTLLNDASMDDETQVQATAMQLQTFRDELKPILSAETATGSAAITTQYGKTEKSCAAKADDVIAELQGIMDYVAALTEAASRLGSASDADVTKLQEAIASTSEAMKSITPPSFLQYMHAGLKDAINKLGEDLQYLLQSAQINDPLRMNAGTYQISVIERQTSKLMEEASKALDRRKSKIESDIGNTQTLLETMRAWVESNSTALQKNTQGSAAKVPLTALPAALTDELQITKINCTYEAQETIIPANYRSLDYIVYLSAWSDNGTADILVSVEIPDITQKYEQKVTLGRAETQLKIHPPLLEGAAKTLNSSKDAQINITVTDISTGKPVLQETKPLKILSRFDMQWSADDGTPYYENILAWVTPEATEVKELLRDAADSINTITAGQITFIGGYQSVSGFENYQVSGNQAAAVMNALAGARDVKYVATPFSSSGTAMQRVATPSEVINQRSGLCIETAVTVASALQATNMHAVLLILPTHAQVALETWQGSGDYILIETTALDDAKTGNYDNVIALLTKDQWTSYLQEKQATVIDCDLAQTLGIQSID